MGKDHLDLPDLGEPDADERTADGPPEVDADEAEAPDPGSLPIDQQALNVIGLAQAREQLRAARRRREQGDDPPADDDELQASVDRHPAGWSRRKPRQPGSGGLGH